MAKRENIAYLSDMKGVVTAPSGAVQGNIALFGADGKLQDSGKKPADFVEQSEIDDAVQEAASEIWDAVNGIYAIQAYASDAWAQTTGYIAGQSCMYDGRGYRCIETHTSGSAFDSSKWRLVLTANGKHALDGMLAAYSNNGLAALLDLAPAYNGNRDYAAGQLAVKNGVLKICTVAGRGPAAIFSDDATVEGAITARIAALASRIPSKTSDLTNDSGFITKNDIPGKLSEFENDSGYVKGEAVDPEYDTSESGYAVGDTCSRGGKFYICTSAVSQGDEWNAEKWRETTLKEIVAAWATGTHPDWDEDDPSSPAYIENKPTIPEATQIDDTLTQEGQAADAKAVGDALARMVDVSKLSYQILNLTTVPSGDPAKIAFNLSDRAVNVVTATIDDNKTIKLNPPAAPTSPEDGVVLSRDFYVVLNITTPNNVPVALSGASLEDYTGRSVSLVAPAEGMSVYKFTESSRSGNVFLVSCYADPAHTAVMDIERALDEILLDGGAGEFTPGIFVPDEQGLFHKVVAVTDENGEVNLGIEQEGVEK